MRKWEIEGELKFLGRLETNTLSAQEDLALLRLTQSLSEQYNKLNKDKELIAEKAKKDGVIFGEDGRATDESNQEALEKAVESSTDKDRYIYYRVNNGSIVEQGINSKKL